MERTLDGVRKQTLTQKKWEFLLIDNNSQPGVESRVSLEGLSRARIVVEKKQGLSHARRRAFQEAAGDLILNLDDDAVLDHDFLEKTEELSRNFPFIGVFGCQMTAEFEQTPKWPVFEYYAAERKVDQNLWSNDRVHIPSTPWGAGSVVRKPVADAYVKKISEDSRLGRLGRTAKNLFSCEDIEIAMIACDLGLGKGIFRDLKFTHLIPAEKMTEEFLFRNAYGNGYSYTIHNWLRFGSLPKEKDLFGKIKEKLRLLRMSKRARGKYLAEAKGIRAAVLSLGKNKH